MRTAALVLLAVLALAGCSGAPVEAAAPPPTTPTTTVRSTTPPPTTQAAVPAQTFEGIGAQVVQLDAPVELGLLTFECPQCSGTITVESDAEFDNVIVNSFLGGPYSGSRWINPRGTTASRIQVQADDAWTLTVGALDERVEQYPAGQPVSGSGDSVFLLDVAPDTAAFTHSGRSNFSVELMTDSNLYQPDLAINEIGAYEGTVLFRVNGTDAGLVQVTADGDWTMTPQ